ncbi:substrate-binding domain-containing protein [Rhizobiaceae bacterium BDR2-2]|uniref:Substrate-binding domain-containing protein n=1 Tax=Ectorhizobium quercum TaxID=2965071 RepID=A0AAE3MY42_9HYPH|nr:substrate-binding domain-containing protein [Ectorhizobium quercum]MCX8997099.1 substrate-binding domain-containing protein [Ectorhizobium quercum]
MRRFITIAAAILLSATASRAETIGVTIAKFDTFQTLLRDGIANYAATVPGLTVDIQDAEGSYDKQVASIRSFIDAKVSAIIVGPVDGDRGTEITRMAVEAGIPLVYLNNEPINIDELPPSQTLVASDEKDAGLLQGREVCRLLGGKGRAVILVGEYFHSAARARTYWAKQALAEDDCKGIQVVEQQSANWQRDLAQKQMKEWLDHGVRFDAVLANNDDMALGAIRAIKDFGRPVDNVVVAGVDATQDALAAMVAGDLDTTVLQSAVGQGEGSVKAALRLIKGETLDKRIYVPFELVTKNNLSQYLPKSQ